MKTSFFGGPLRPSGTIFLGPRWLARARMTATAIMFIGSGFAVAADGNQLFGDPPNSTPDFNAGETDRAQKIFGVEARNLALAYIVRGNVANQSRTFDASIELRHIATSVGRERFAKPKEFVAAVANALERRMERAVESGLLPHCLGLEIPFIGFLDDEPFCINAHFYPLRAPSGVHHEIIGQSVDGWLFAFSGSVVVAQLMQKSDIRIRTPLKLPSEHPSLQDAIDATLAYVQTCSPPIGLDVDPENCRGIGGHIHIATVTPLKRPSWFANRFRGARAGGGFKWVIPPKG